MVDETGMGRRRAAAAVDSSALYQERRQAIVDSATKLFNQQGYKTTNFAKIAEELSSDRATIYYYFSSKQELLDEVVRQASEKNLAAVAEIVDGSGSASEKLTRALASLMESYNSNYPFMLFLQKFLLSVAPESPQVHRESQGWAGQYYAAIRSILQQGVDSGEFELRIPVGVAALATIGTVNWVHASGMTNSRRRHVLGGDSLSPSEMGTGLADFVLHGLHRKD